MKQINKAQAFKQYTQGNTIHILPDNMSLESSFTTSLQLTQTEIKEPLKALFESEINQLHDMLCSGSMSNRLKYKITN